MHKLLQLWAELDACMKHFEEWSQRTPAPGQHFSSSLYQEDTALQRNHLMQLERAVTIWKEICVQEYRLPDSPPPSTSTLGVQAECDFMRAVVREGSLHGIKRDRFLWLAGIAYDALSKPKVLRLGWFRTDELGFHRLVEPFELADGQSEEEALKNRYPGQPVKFKENFRRGVMP